MTFRIAWISRLVHTGGAAQAEASHLHLQEAVLLQQLLMGCLLLGSFQLPLLHHVAGNGLRVCAAQAWIVRVEARLGCCLPSSKLVQAMILRTQVVLAKLWRALLSSGAMSDT